MGVAMAMTNLSKWKWNVMENKNETFVCIIVDAHISMPRICDIEMTKGIVIIEERFLMDVTEEGEKFTLSLHLASEDAISWITNQLQIRAKFPY